MDYSERVTPPPAITVLLALLGGSFGLILVPIGAGLAAGAAAVCAAVVVIAVVASSLRIEVSGSDLRVGSAHIDVAFIGDIRISAKENTRRLMGVDADLRAWTAHRALASGALQLTIDDPRDPTPYWLVSTNRPDELARALHAAKENAARRSS